MIYFGVTAMVFSSLIFLYLFLPLCLLVYFLMPKLQAKNIVLVIFSLVFYAWGEPTYVFLMLGSATFNYFMGKCMARTENKKALLVLAVIGNLAALGVFKYAGLFVQSFKDLTGLPIPVPEIALPIGISFFTFQAMTYVVDVYRGQVGVQQSWMKFLLYISMFPQLIAGPIVRYSDIAEQIEHRRSTPEGAFRGMLRFVTGLAKKILIADYAFDICSKLLDGVLGSGTTLGVWYGVLMFAFQLYFDFSGYSDMAIGLGQIFGFRFRENFDLPYISQSITEFWRRWHISLSTFFRDYVYIPLCGNRRHRLLNLFITWSLTGFWHGASWNFLLWGMYFFVLLSVEKQILPVLKHIPSIFRRIGTILMVLVGWTIFYFTDFSRLGEAFRVMLGLSGTGWWNTDLKIQLLNSLPLLILCILGSTGLPRLLRDVFAML
ncbi:MAG: MBOAT family protein, partial [Peptococcaceae bacterium]|nr:MBOAT family protein [Peptococcaceae bacterium]